eukprot:TRINITY_DN32732_c0_g1_i1.p1 TRINITY_DN32732_c0_g1~~TRINITY_DN32732_c0_g1_i1.p1  ORF type:complete len:315 (+),score=46.41 TRINITY_DN32732_c0_g1_i1:241-1185(+)
MSREGLQNDRLGATSFLVDEIVDRFKALPATMVSVQEVLRSDELSCVTPADDFPVILCDHAAKVLRDASATSQLFHYLINLCTINFPAESTVEHACKQQLMQLQEKLGRMEGHLSAGIAELSQTIRLALQKAPMWHIQQRAPQLAVLGFHRGLYPGSPVSKRNHRDAFPTGTTPPGASIPTLPTGVTPPGAGFSLSTDPSSPTARAAADFATLSPPASPTAAKVRGIVGSKIWGAQEADAASLSRFTAAASVHAVRRVAMALLSAMCLVEREMQSVPQRARLLLGDARVAEIWGGKMPRRSGSDAAFSPNHGYL